MDELERGRPDLADLRDEPGGGTTLPYGWAICPTFADCIYTSQKTNVVAHPRRSSSAATNGTLPNLSLVMPDAALAAQHLLDGDGRQLDRAGRERDHERAGLESTAIFITYDDCGCFYDHVAPPPGDGPRCRW